MKRAVIITATGFRDEEYIYPYYRLLEEEFKVDVATPDGNTVLGKFGVPAKANKTTTSLSVLDYDLVYITGGLDAPDKLRMQPEVLKFVQEMDQQKKVVASICHGIWVLISAGITKGRKITAYWSLEADVINSGAEYLHKVPVVVDGNMITSPHYNDNPAFMKAILQKFQ
ncbi:MAG: type 1 glutamine amidotransferase domain-containing protein [bacterium]|nr:type 1 glutamine amidotransferase domain-containing protein [bacterium]